MKNRKQTSTQIAALAAKTLADPRSTKTSKALAGSALAQALTRPKRRNQNAA